jgi:hypothetical protein
VSQFHGQVMERGWPKGIFPAFKTFDNGSRSNLTSREAGTSHMGEMLGPGVVQKGRGISSQPKLKGYEQARCDDYRAS